MKIKVIESGAPRRRAGRRLARRGRRGRRGDELQLGRRGRRRVMLLLLLALLRCFSWRRCRRRLRRLRLLAPVDEEARLEGADLARRRRYRHGGGGAARRGHGHAPADHEVRVLQENREEKTREGGLFVFAGKNRPITAKWTNMREIDLSFTGTQPNFSTSPTIKQRRDPEQTI